MQRERVVSGAGFAQALVFSFMAQPQATRCEVRQTAASAGMLLSTQGLDKRMNGKAAYFLDSLLAEAVKQVVCAHAQPRSLLSRFKGVYISDSTVVALPSALAAVFEGVNGAQDAAVKVAVQWDVGAGGLGVWLGEGKVHDQRTGAVTPNLPAGSLRLNDLGFFNLSTFAEDVEHQRYFFSRYKVGTLVYDEDGKRLDLAQELAGHGQQAVDRAIYLGSEHLPCRLIALPVSPQQVGKRRRRLAEIARKRQHPPSSQALALAAWTLYITNIPTALLATHQAPALGATRWQIECLFKRWKSQGQLATSRSHNPYRVLCEFYAKLLACLIQHWLLLVSCWHRLERSLYQATQLLHKRAFCLLDALHHLPTLILVLERTAQLLALTCGLSTRSTHPLTFQQWIEDTAP